MSGNGVDDIVGDWQKSSSRGGGGGRCLAERVAARAGFSAAPRLNTQSIMTSDNSSPYLTIPPGLSPTTLLDSPIFLSNSLLQPSPTTGKFESFAFKPATGKTAQSQTQFFDPPIQNRNSPTPQDQVGFDTAAHSPPIAIDYEQGDQRVSGDSMAASGGAPSEDGYNWRKYGQKQVKGSEFPRSYYKCTHPNCQVKKKVERSHEGHITEIIYKGAHNHPKPPLNRRSAFGSSNPLVDLQLDAPQHAGSQNENGDTVWASVPKGTGTANSTDWRHDNIEVTSSTTLLPEYANGSTTSLHVQNDTHYETGDAVDASPTFSNDEDEDDRGTHGSVSLGYDCEGEESELKRRKIEAYAAEMSGATRAIREPRVVVQTTSEVDILDDGYRWRKYGQKVVKGNPNPRSYYKCTSAGCTVRKHVERASHDLKAVITTYEGKHNHDVPAARNSSHINSSVARAQPAHRPEPSQAHSSSSSSMVRPNCFSTFSLPGKQQQQVGHSPAFSFAMSQPGLANLAMAGFSPGQHKFPALPIHPFMTQQRPMNEMGFMLPKGEPKMEPIPEPASNLSNSSAAAAYQQIMNSLPLGPQM